MPSILGGECEPHRALQDESEEQLKQKHQELEEVKEAVLLESSGRNYKY